MKDIYSPYGLRGLEHIGAFARGEVDAFKVAHEALGISSALESVRKEMQIAERLRIFENLPRYDVEQWRNACGLLPRDLFDSARGVLGLPSAVANFRDAATGSILAENTFRGVLGLDWGHALKSAQIAGSIALPGVLEGYRTATDQLASKLAFAQLDPSWDERLHLSAFGKLSAYSDLLSASSRVNGELCKASATILGLEIPQFGALRDFRWFLDSSGLTLPRWPRVRVVSAAERRKRFRQKLQQNSEPKAVRIAKSMTHRYENVLRDFIDAAMALEYGDDWAERRLPLCGCQDLFGKWKKRGGEVLKHADFAHYIRIMSHPEHFELVFSAGYDDPDELAKVLEIARVLRAASHHGHVFTMENVRDLRIAWRTIEAGLIALMPSHELEFA